MEQVDQDTETKGNTKRVAPAEDLPSAGESSRPYCVLCAVSPGSALALSVTQGMEEKPTT